MAGKGSALRGNSTFPADRQCAAPRPVHPPLAQLARLGALEAAAGERAAAVAHLSEQLADSWAEVHAAGLQLDDKAAQVALLEDKVEKKR